MEIAASRRDRCATTGSIGSEATGPGSAGMRSLRTWEGPRALREDSSPMSFAPRAFTTGTLVRANENESMVRMEMEIPMAIRECAVRSAQVCSAGISDPGTGSDPSHAICRNYNRLTVNSPGAGGGQKFSIAIATDRRHPHSEIFFFAAEIFGAVLSVSSANSFGQSMHAVALRASRTRIYFPTPRGAVRSLRGRCRGPVASDTNFSRGFRNIFLRPSPRGAVKCLELSIADRWPGKKNRRNIGENIFFHAPTGSEKLSRNSGWGGSVDRRDI